MKFDFIVFDLDGTLVNSIHDYTEATNKLLAEFNCTPVSVETVTYHLGYGLKKFVIDLFPEQTHTPEGVELIGEKFFNYYDDVCLNHTHLYEGVTEFFARWEGEVAIVTNKAEKHALKIIDHLLPHQDFVAIFGADSLQEKKPHPLPILTAIEKSSANIERTLMVGDSDPDILSSQAAGCQVVGVTYGYGDERSVRSHNPDFMIDEFNQLLKIVY